MRLLTSLLALLFTLSLQAQNYSVGHSSLNFKDASRSGGFSISGGTTVPTGGTGRTIGTEVYYPATSTGDNTPFATGIFPVVIIGHGFAMGWDSYTTLTDSLVKNGYIVALPRTEGSLLPAPSHLDFGKDLAKVAELMGALNTTSGSVFNGKQNGRMAIGGHSMGGGATFLSDAFAPSSVKCYFTFAAAETNPSAVTAAAAVTRPHLVFAGTYDCVAAPATNQTLMYNALTNSVCRTYINITKAYHCAFADNNFNCGFGEGTCITAGGLSSTAQQAIVRMYLNPYLDYYLKQICPAWTKFQNLTDTATISTVQAACTISVPSNAAINGSTTFCAGNPTTLTAAPSGFNYTWSDNSTGSSLSVSSGGTYSLLVGNGTCVLPSVSVSVTQGFPPAVPSAITASDTVCSGISNINISVPNQANTNFNWTLPNGWSITSGSGTNAITVTSGNAGGQIEVTAQNSCGLTAATQKSIVVVPSNLDTPGAIAGNSALCPSENGWYAIAPVSAAASYMWNLPSGWAGAPLDSSAIQISLGATAASGQLSVMAVNSCGSSVASSQSITIKPLPSVTDILSSSIICQGQGSGITFASQSANVDSFVWSIPNSWTFDSGNANSVSPVLNMNATGSVTLTGYNECGSSLYTESFTVIDTPQPVLTVQGSVLTSSITGSSYTWFYNGNVIPNENGQSLTATSNGLYSVVVMDGNGCSGQSSTVNVTIIGIAKPLLEDFKIYPNPVLSNSDVRLQVPSEKIGESVEVRDAQGKLLLKEKILVTSFTLPMSNLSAGVYLIKVGSTVKRLVVE